MKVHTATFVASAVSGITLIASLVGVFNIYSSVQSAWAELDTEMSSFKGATDDLWRDIQSLTGGSRHRRQAYGGYGGYGAPQPQPPHLNARIEPNVPSFPVPSPAPLPKIPGGRPGVPTNNGPPSIPPALDREQPQGGCQCKAVNKCPAGPRGPKGVAGKPGPNGIEGKDGHPGKPALDYTPEREHGGCFNCPAGPQGSPGPIGRPGARGMVGPRGQDGMPARDGSPGHPGEMGQSGPPGPDGLLGPAGEKGHDGTQPIGRPGPKGRRGEQGPKGPLGGQGFNAGPGFPGPRGQPGNPGPQGPRGHDGEQGEEGPTGRPGKDAEYCRCPDHVGQGFRKL